MFYRSVCSGLFRQLGGLFRQLGLVVVTATFLCLALAGSTAAATPAPAADEWVDRATSTALVLGVPVSTAAWALLGLALIAGAMAATSRSRSRVLTGLFAPTSAAARMAPPAIERTEAASASFAVSAVQT